MEELKPLSELTTVDERHTLIGQITGRMQSIETLYRAVSSIELHEGVPEPIIGQFNVARNMVLYQHFYYALAPEVQLKTYTIIELALKTKANKRLSLGALIRLAVKENWISDAGFRHIVDPKPENPYCQTLIQVLPDLRNESAHGSTHLTPDSLGHLEKCADLINQLFPRMQNNSAQEVAFP